MILTHHGLMMFDVLCGLRMEVANSNHFDLVMRYC